MMAVASRAMRRELRMAELKATIASAQQQLDMLEAEDLIPEEPTADWMTIEVQYAPGGTWFRYLILHTPQRGYFTTGTKAETKHFSTWEDMYNYFYGPEIHRNRGFKSMWIFSGPSLTPAKQ